LKVKEYLGQIMASQEIDRTLNDLRFMEYIGWYCEERKEYEKIREEEFINSRFEILDL